MQNLAFRTLFRRNMPKARMTKNNVDTRYYSYKGKIEVISTFVYMVLLYPYCIRLLYKLVLSMYVLNKKCY